MESHGMVVAVSGDLQDYIDSPNPTLDCEFLDLDWIWDLVLRLGHVITVFVFIYQARNIQQREILSQKTSFHFVKSLSKARMDSHDPLFILPHQPLFVVHQDLQSGHEIKFYNLVLTQNLKIIALRQILPFKQAEHLTSRPAQGRLGFSN